MLDKELKQFREKINEIKAEKRILSAQLLEKEVEKSEAEIFGVDCLEARSIIQAVAEKTQGLMVRYFTNLITPLLRAIWLDNREFIIEFVKKRNTTECECFISKDGNRAGIFDSSGGGVKNLVSLGCRLAFFALEKKSRPLFILDEPFSSLNSEEYQERVASTIKEISDKMGVQFLIISDQSNLSCDRLFRVENGNVKIVYQ